MKRRNLLIIVLVLAVCASALVAVAKKPRSIPVPMTTEVDCFVIGGVCLWGGEIENEGPSIVACDCIRLSQSRAKPCGPVLIVRAHWLDGRVDWHAPLCS